jgi:alkyl hydroperoxide reductase subunit AhpF
MKITVELEPAEALDILGNAIAGMRSWAIVHRIHSSEADGDRFLGLRIQERDTGEMHVLELAELNTGVAIALIRSPEAARQLAANVRAVDSVVAQLIVQYAIFGEEKYC